MRRVVITGLGIVSCLGNDKKSVSDSLREMRSGITHQPEYETMGFRSQVAGAPVIDLEASIDRKLRRFMGPAAAYAYVAMKDAIAHLRSEPRFYADSPEQLQKEVAWILKRIDGELPKLFKTLPRTPGQTRLWPALGPVPGSADSE